MANIALTSAGTIFSSPTGSLNSGGLAGLGNGDRTTAGAYNSGTNTWVSVNTASVGSPVIVEANFGQSRTINKISVIGLREATHYTEPPSANETNPSYKNLDFTVDYWNGASWVNIAIVAGNDKVIRDFSFSAVTTTKIRIVVTQGGTFNIYLVEIEVYEAAPPPADVTNLTVDANRNINSDAVTGATGYLTQRRINGGVWEVLAPITKAFQDNENLPTAIGSYTHEYRRWAYNGLYSVNWSNIAALNYIVYPPPIIRSLNGLFAQTGKSYQVQLQAFSGTGSFTWSETVGNLPNGALSQSGLVTIPLVENFNYTFVARATDVNTNAYDEESFTIIVTPYAAIAFCYVRPLAEEEILKQRVFEPVQGDDETAEDAAPQYQFTLKAMYVGGVPLSKLREFLTLHRKRQKFYWINPDLNNQALLVKRVDNYKANHALNYGGFEFTVRTINGFDYVG